MKAILAALALTLATLANAAQIKIADMPRLELDGAFGVTAEFEVNETLNRTWVKFTSRTYGEDGDTHEFRSKVPGLSFDSSTDKIMLDVEGQLVECAQLVRKTRWYRSRKITPTGRCTFEERFVTVEEDNGFEIEKKQRFQLFLNVE